MYATLIYIYCLSFSNKKEKHALVVGWYGTETLGDIAILAGICELLRERFSKIYVVSFDMTVSNYTQANNLQLLSDVEFITFKKASKKINKDSRVFFGGGPLMTIYSLLTIYPLWIVSYLRSGSNVILGCGVGPINDSFILLFLRKFLNSAHRVILRDHKSKELFKNICGKNQKVNVITCPSTLYLQKKTAHNYTSPNIINICMRQYPWTQYNHKIDEKESAKIMQKTESEILKFIEKIVFNSKKFILRPIPMCTNEHGGNDMVYMRNLFYNVPEGLVDWSFCNYEKSLDEYITAFQNCSFTIGMRYHSIVFAHEIGGPVLAIDYTEGNGKITAYCKENNLKSIAYSKLLSSNFESYFNNELRLTVKPSRNDKFNKQKFLEVLE